MTTNQILIEINNTACDFLERGYHQEAYRLLKKALQILQYSFKGETSSAPFVKDSVLEHLSQINGQSMLPRSTSSSNHGLTTYDRAFKIIPKDQDTTASEQLPLENAVVVIYNIALSMHLWAIQDGAALSSQKVQKALKQYGNTRKILDSMMQYQGDMLPILMSTLNNEAQLYYENCQYDCSSQCLESLETVILKSHSKVSTKMTNMDNKIFHRNIIAFKSGSTRSAPAA